MISLLQAEKISKSFGDLVLFEDLSFSIHKGQKIALIAKNGAGKSSLLDILTLKDKPDNGQIAYKNDLKVGFLEQNPQFDETKTVLEEVFSSSSEIVNLIKRYEKLIHSDEPEELAKVMDLMDLKGAWDYEVKVKQILEMLSITDFDQKISELSGGQKKRLAMANVLINELDLLILDEPTNHLNLEMIEWLEAYLKSTKSALLMVTHDRYFLDRVCDRIIELEDRNLYTYNGNYTYYLEKRYERIQNQNAELSKARNLLKKEREWVNKTPSARTTKAKYRVDAFYDLKDKARGKAQDLDVRLNVETTRLGKKVLNIKRIHKSFDDKKILEDFSLNFNKGDKIGIIGKNGAGKSTLLNILTGKIKADRGHLDYGETVVIGYYEQDGIKFDKSQRVIDIIKDIAEYIRLKGGHKVSASQFLQFFLFSPPMQQTLVEKLSGGEKRRLYLMTVLMKNPNFLILDEPTNDLDIMTLHVLEEYLQHFQGSLIIVSHDRYFMDNIINHLLVFEGDAKISGFAGNYTQYRNEVLIPRKRAIQAKPKQEKKEKEKPSDTVKTKLSYKEKTELENLDKDLESLQKEKTELEAKMSDASTPVDELVEASKRLNVILSEIDEKEMRWLELSDF